MCGELDERAIEKHSRFWARPAAPVDGALATAMLEAYALAERSKDFGDLYFAMIAKLAAWRGIMVRAFESPGTDSFLGDLMERARTAVVGATVEYIDHVWRLREAAGGRLVRVVNASGALVAYRVHAARLIEALALWYFLEPDMAQREIAAQRLRKIIASEKGAAQPISDRYAVSVVAATRALIEMGCHYDAGTYLRQVATWTLGQYADRSGLASLEADEEQATELFLSADFPELKHPKRSESFLITAVTDLAAYLGDQELYSDIVSDIATNRVYPEYVVMSDTVGQFFFEDEGLPRIVNIPLEFDTTVADHCQNAPHLRDEPAAFRIAERYGSETLLAISLLLRDRYFPTTFLR